MVGPSTLNTTVVLVLHSPTQEGTNTGLNYWNGLLGLALF